MSDDPELVEFMVNTSEALGITESVQKVKDNIDKMNARADGLLQIIRRILRDPNVSEDLKKAIGHQLQFLAED